MIFREKKYFFLWKMTKHSGGIFCKKTQDLDKKIFLC